MTRVHLIAAACGLAAGVLAAPADASWYARQKTLDWDIKDAKSGKPFGGGDSCKYQSLTGAFAQDRHKKDAPLDAGGKADPVFPYQFADVINTPDKYRAPVKFKEVRWGRGTFDQSKFSTDADHPTDLYTKYFNPSTDHAMAEASASITAHMSTETSVHLSLHVGGSAAVSFEDVKDPRHGPETAYAQGISGAQVTLKGRLTKGEWSDFKEKKEGKVGVGANGEVRVVGGATDQGALFPKKYEQPVAGSRDPVSLSFYDEATGELLASQTLYRDLWLAEGDAEVVYTPEGGLRLRADPEGTATVEFDTPGSWVKSPFSGTVLIDDGKFSAGGAFAGLDWFVETAADGTLTASLAPSEFSPKFTIEYAVGDRPPSLGDVLAVLDSDTDGIAQDYGTIDIPAPGALSVLGLGLLAVRRRR